MRLVIRDVRVVYFLSLVEANLEVVGEETFDISVDKPLWVMISIRDRSLVGKHDTVGRAYICLDPRRFGGWMTTEYGARKNEEAYEHVFILHHPDEEREACRPLRTSPAYDRQKARGAQFGHVRLQSIGAKARNNCTDLSYMHRRR